MCNEFVKEKLNITFVFPNLNSLTENDIIEIEKFINNKIFFDFKNIFSLQINFLKQINEKLWFLIKNITFKIGLFYFLINNRKLNIYSRDLSSLKMIVFLKRLPFFNIKLFFELHQHKRRYLNAINQCDKLIVINKKLQNIVFQNLNKKSIIAHDGVYLEEFSSLNFKN